MSICIAEAVFRAEIGVSVTLSPKVYPTPPRPWKASQHLTPKLVPGTLKRLVAT